MGSGAAPLWARKAPPSLNSSHMHELNGEAGGRGLEGEPGQKISWLQHFRQHTHDSHVPFNN